MVICVVRYLLMNFRSGADLEKTTTASLWTQAYLIKDTTLKEGGEGGGGGGGGGGIFVITAPVRNLLLGETNVWGWAMFILCGQLRVSFGPLRKRTNRTATNRTARI